MAESALLRARVYDPVLRLIHAGNALAVLVLLVSGQVVPGLGWSETATLGWSLHVHAGYALMTGLIARLVWGWVGPGQARWTSLWHPGAWRGAFRHGRWFVAPTAFGHHPVASLAYLVIYAALAVMVVSGLALAAIDRNTGPLYDWLGNAVLWKGGFRMPHAWLQYLVLVFVLAHFSALVLHRRLHGIPVAQAMITGNQYLRRERE